MAIELKPCPFCGGKAEVVYDPDGVTQSDGVEWKFTAVCNRCAASSGLCRSEEHAVEAWNRRADNG